MVCGGSEKQGGVSEAAGIGSSFGEAARLGGSFLAAAINRPVAPQAGLPVDGKSLQEHGRPLRAIRAREAEMSLERNKELARPAIAIWSTGDFSRALEIFAPD